MNKFRVYKFKQSEKTQNLLGMRKYAVLTSVNCEKDQIKSFVEKMFSVQIESVNSSFVRSKKKVFRGKVGETKNFKKFYITLKPNFSIDLNSDNSKDVK